MRNTKSLNTALCIAAALASNSAALGGLGFDVVVPGFGIPDNDPEGGESSVHLPSFGVPGAMTLRIRFPSADSEDRHTWCGDLVARLTFTPDTGAPPRSVILFNRIGATSATSRGDDSDLAMEYSFSDSHPYNMWEDAALTPPEGAVPNGQYRPSSRGPDFQYLPTSMFQAFGGFAPAGTWTLNISDHAAGDTGRVVNWTISPFIPAPGTGALIAAAGLVALRRRR